MSSAADAIDVPLRLLSTLTDAATSAVLGRPTRLRLHLSPGGVLAARTDRIVVGLEDLHLAGLDVASVRVDAHRVAVRPGWPPRLLAGPVEVRATLTQSSIDRWLLADALPVRIRLRDDGLSIRTGAVGLRLAEVGASIAIDGGRLVVIPQRARVIGVDVPTAGFRVVLPLPPLPRESSLTSVAVVADAITVGIRLPTLDEPLTPDLARRLRPLLTASRARATGGPGTGTGTGARARGRRAPAGIVPVPATNGGPSPH